MSVRLKQHILFWVLYFIVCLYNELYISPSFLIHPTLALFLQSSLTILLILAVKVIVVYFILYKLIPQWENGKNAIEVFSIGILSVLAGAVIIRVLIHFVIIPFVYQEDLKSFNVLAILARYFYSVLDILQIVGVAVSIKFYKLRMESMKNERNLVIEKNKAELLLLKSQTNPHFLFNTLNSIYSLARTNSKQTSDSIMRLSKLLRYTLYDSNESKTTIGDELKVVKDYIVLQQLRFGNRITLDLVVDIDDESVKIAPLLLLPIFENAYKHCDQTAAIIFFEIQLRKSKLTFKTKNPVSSNKDLSLGIGLTNLRKQLEILYKEFVLQYKIQDEDFELELSINLNSYGGNELFDIGR